MKLTYSEGLFRLDASIVDGDIAKRAGFGLDRKTQTWLTPFATVAAKVSSTADNLTKSLILNRLKIEKQNVVASSATWSGIKVPAPPGLTFKPFQLAGIEWLYDRKEAILADEMGLGKTIQAIGLCNLVEPETVLVICPASLKINWRREWKKWSTTTGARVLVTNYAMVAKQIERLRLIKWSVLIIDEGHKLKNPEAKRTAAVLGRWARTKAERVEPIRAERKIVLTGTPILNKPIEFFQILKYLMPHGFISEHHFAVRYCGAVRKGSRWDYSGASNLEELQEKLRSSIMVRRMKSEVLKDLPPKVRQIIELDDKGVKRFLKKEKTLWEKMTGLVGVKDKDTLDDREFREIVKLMEDGESIPFEEISTIRKENAIAKVPLVLDHLWDAANSSGKVVVFAHHKEVVSLLEEEFGNQCVTLTGGMTDKRKQLAVDTFQNDAKVPFFVGNIEAAGVGHTLTAGSHVIFIEEDWVPGNITQAEDRCHRIGQHDSVLVQHLVIAGSIDANMAKAIVRKQEVIERVVDKKRSPLFISMMQ